MTKKDTSNGRILPDLLNMDHEYLFKTVGKEGKYSLELKCLFLVLLLYVPGLITTAFAGTSEIYVFRSWRNIASSIFIGIFIWLLIRFMKRIDKKIQNVSRTLSPPRKKEGREEWVDWKRKINKYKKEVHRLDSRRKYYFCATIGAFCGFVFGIFVINPEVGWVNKNLFNELYLRIWYIFVGFLVGASMHFITAGFWVVRNYCRTVVSHNEILPLDPDRTGGLRELGQLSFDLDLIVALPSLAFPLYLLQNPELAVLMNNAGPWIVISILYFLVLIFVFFVSISPAHDDMVEAKTKYLLKIHREYKDMHKEILQKLEPEKLIDPEEYKRLTGLYGLYDRVERMAVWPLDFQTTLRFSLTSLLPIFTIGISISF